MSTLIDSPFITLGRNETGYDYESERKRKFAQNGELMRVYYATEHRIYFGVMTTKSKRATFTGTFSDIYNLAEKVFEDQPIAYLNFVRPTTFPQDKEARLQSLLKTRDAELDLLKRYLLLLL